jgi:uncharacterized protein (DUF433 family)
MSQADVQHIVESPETCGGKPRIAGTRIRVWDVHVWHDLQGLSPLEIIAAYPQLTLADVYAALAYYHDHRAALESQQAQSEAFAKQLEAQQGSTPFTRLRDGSTDENSVSSG